MAALSLRQLDEFVWVSLGTQGLYVIGKISGAHLS
jgi:hypothetical protein